MSKEIQLKTVIAYVDEYNNEPYTDWLENIKDQKTKERIKIRVRRLESGLYGDCEPVGEGVSELRMFFGSGYRVYFGEDDENTIILLCGGDKDTQDRNIKTAKKHWKEYKENVQETDLQNSRSN